MVLLVFHGGSGDGFDGDFLRHSAIGGWYPRGGANAPCLKRTNALPIHYAQNSYWCNFDKFGIWC